MASIAKFVAGTIRSASGIGALIFLLCVSPAGGQEASSADEESDRHAEWATSPLSFNLTMYLWFTSLSGDVGVRGLPPAEIDVDFKDIFEKIDWFPPPLMLAGQVRYDRMAFLTDVIYLGMEGDGASSGPLPSTAEADLKTLIWTFGGSYRVIQGNAFDLDLLAGARLWMLDTNLKLTGPLAVREFGGSETWVDPLVGVAARVSLGGGFALRAEGDVGGFGIGADLDWQLLGTLMYQVDDALTLEAGYRYLAIDYDNGGFLFDTQLQGPIIGGTIQF